jgi:thiamine biosynthesis lipoprotein ApbE
VSQIVPAQPSHLATTTWGALGTSVTLRTTERRSLEAGRAVVERELQLIDRACSRFREDSELRRVNDRAGRFVRVSPLLIGALDVALRAAALTAGDVDPTLGGFLLLAGYDRDWERLAQPAEKPTPVRLPGSTAVPGSPRARRQRSAVSVRRHPGWQAVEIDRASSAIRLPAGVSLDLGATAKAWATDRAVAAVHLATGSGTLLSLGGDIAVAGDPPEGGWRVRVTDDHRDGPGAPGQTVSIRSGGLATSSVAVRRWLHHRRVMHHIVDPLSGQPALGTWRTVSVAAASCLDANIASTASLVRAAAAPAWLDGLGLPARLVSHGGAVHTVACWGGDRRPAERAV